jgi:hypothetical protein
MVIEILHSLYVYLLLPRIYTCIKQANTNNSPYYFKDHWHRRLCLVHLTSAALILAVQIAGLRTDVSTILKSSGAQRTPFLLKFCGNGTLTDGPEQSITRSTISSNVFASATLKNGSKVDQLSMSIPRCNKNKARMGDSQHFPRGTDRFVCVN